MACITKVVAATWVLTAVLVIHVVDGKKWPDFSCLPVNKSTIQDKAVDHHEMGWESCLESYEEYKGNCAKVCMLLRDRIVSRKEIGGPVIFNATTFIAYFGEELGSGESQKETLRRIGTGLEKCTQNHPEIKKLKTRKSPCEPWNNFLACLDKAIGC